MDNNKKLEKELGTFKSMIASGPVIIKNFNGIQKTLLVKHGNKPLEELKWKFCGGKILPGLSLEENAIRKAREEIGVQVKIIRSLNPLILWQEVPESGTEKPEATVLIHYLAEIEEDPQKGEKILDMEWFDVNNLPFDSAPNIKPVIENYLNQLSI